MAQIVLGLGTAHGPMLSIPAVNWSDRAKFDRANKEMYFQGRVYDFEQLTELRRPENLAAQCELAEQERRHARCQAGIRQLGDIYAEAAPDVTIILGNDQMEVFKAEHVPAFAIFWGAYVEGIPRTPEFLAKLPPGIPQAEMDRTPAVYTQYPTSPEWGRYLIERLAGEFDVAQLTKLPTGEIGSNAVPHAYGFVYRRILRDQLRTSVPVFINTFYPPNQPGSRRCYEFGRALGRAIAAWPGNQRIAVIASGGLSHFVVDEALDRKLIAAMEAGDAETLCRVPEAEYQSGTSEWKNWIAAAGLMHEAGLKMKMVDYVPCYRSEAGTGSGLGFGVWR
jgi:OH-DDVA oxygenase/3-O-methylgallate 3,4-dioxygenase